MLNEHHSSIPGENQQTGKSEQINPGEKMYADADSTGQTQFTPTEVTPNVQQTSEPAHNPRLATPGSPEMDTPGVKISKPSDHDNSEISQNVDPGSEASDSLKADEGTE